MEYEESVNDDWEKFLSGDIEEEKDETETNNSVPKCGDIYISTKTKIAYLNNLIDINNVFWKIPILPYHQAKNGVIKKQIKQTFTNEEEIKQMETRLKSEKYYTQHIITQIKNPSGRIKFKDVRKLTVGLSKKDILTHRSKKKGAFYNCFVMILRLKVNDSDFEKFKEIHVKVFNTGKLEIPGLQNDINLDEIMCMIIRTLQPYVKEKLSYEKDKIETVLINSNFCCNYYIEREKFYNILKFDYNIHTIYDPCSYPGIQCKYYLDNEDSDDKTKKKNHISFMIFRTGSILIVGKCVEEELYKVYEYLKDILNKEYHKINVKKEIEVKDKNTVAKKKKNKKLITITCN